jgi:SAM-dependent methyltransferase
MSTQPPDLFANRRDRFRQYDTPVAVTAYLARLANSWPERPQIALHIAKQISALGKAAPRVLELCCGPGWLAAQLLPALPTMHYVGVDISPPFLDFAQAELALHADRIALLEVDLSATDWPTALAKQVGADPFDAIISLQSLHDVGDATTIERLYGQCKALLAPGGRLLNADLIVQPGELLPDNPGRLTVERHLELLAARGFTAPVCTLRLGAFGCVSGYRGEAG